MVGWRTAVFSLFTLALFAQDVTIRGHVVDETNAPLPGAEITLLDRRVYADPTGAFSIDVPAPGEYSLRVALPGYFDLRDRKVQLAAGVNEISLVLNRLRDRLESLDVSGVSSVVEMDKTAPEQRLTSTELLEIPYKTNNDIRSYMRALHGVRQDS